MHAYAWPQDPIANAFIAQSGAAGVLKGRPDQGMSQWYRISSKVGCGGAKAGEATIECMRGKDTKAIMDAIGKDALGKEKNGLAIFAPTVDNKTVFADYQALGKAGKFAKKVGRSSFQP